MTGILGLKKTYDELELLQTNRSQTSRIPLFGILENIRSLYNVGSIFRTSDGAGLSGLFLTGITGTPPSKEIEKTALGATDFIEWDRFSTAADCLKSFEGGVTAVALERSRRGVPYTELELPEGKPVVLVVGNEITGVDEGTLELCDIHTEIPMFGQKHSLNVSVAFGILAFHLSHLLRRGA